MDGEVSFSVIEYEPTGSVVREATHTVRLERPPSPFEDLEKSGASRTGAKSVPDNTDSLGVLFCMRVPTDEPPTRRLIPVWEVETPWRRGWGIATWSDRTRTAKVYGLWVPWRRPRTPKVEVFIDHEARHVAPSELVGPPV